MKTRPWRNQMIQMTGEPNKRCTLSQLVINWATAQPSLTHVLAGGGHYLAQVTENANAGELNFETAGVVRICKDVVAFGEPTNG